MISIRSARRLLMALLALGSVTARPTGAQEAQPAVYSIYLNCNPNQEARVDSLMRSFWAPIADRHVAAGHATAWGWLSHHTGGTWDRALYFVAPDVDHAIQAVEGVIGDAMADAEAWRLTQAGCGNHEDYIWQRITGSQPAGQLGVDRPAAGLSIYYECSQATEDRADALVSSAFAPVFNRAVERGDLNSWGWMEHIVGGRYRRLLVTDARDARTVVAAIGRISGELGGMPTFREFSEICPTHQDYVWNIMSR